MAGRGQWCAGGANWALVVLGDLRGARPAPGARAGDDDVVATVAIENHPNAVKLARGEMLSALPFLPLGGAALVAGLMVRELRMIAMPGLIAAAWATGRIVQYVRVVREDPVKRWRRELRENHELTEIRSDLEIRSVATTPWWTIALIALVVIVTIVEFISGVRAAVPAAALVKSAVRAGQWWRLVSAAFLHVNLAHLVGNMAGLWSLARLVEVYDRRSRIPLVFLLSAIGCSLASTAFEPRPALGASGGVAGFVGYLLITASAQPDGAPGLLRKNMWSLVAGLALTATVGPRNVDNAGHVGGLIAGALTGIVVRTLAKTPEGDQALDAAGRLSIVVLVATATFTITRLI